MRAVDNRRSGFRHPESVLAKQGSIAVEFATEQKSSSLTRQAVGHAESLDERRTAASDRAARCNVTEPA